MSITGLINKTLSGFVDDNIWPFLCPKDKPPDKYIVYNPEHETAALQADDENLEWSKGFQIHLYKKNKDSKLPVNYFADKDDITSALVKKGFFIRDIDVLYEKDTGYTHICWSCEPDIEF